MATEPTVRTARIAVEASAFRKMMFRALNTMEPEKTPPWAHSLYDGTVDDDEIEIVIKRKVTPPQEL